MNAKLRRSCAALWVLGIAGMWVARALLTLEPHALPFRVAAGLWVLGGLGYTGLGLVCLCSQGSDPEAIAPLGELTYQPYRAPQRARD